MTQGSSDRIPKIQGFNTEPINFLAELMASLIYSIRTCEADLG
jgi:hypothetical protein